MELNHQDLYEIFSHADFASFVERRLLSVFAVAEEEVGPLSWPTSSASCSEKCVACTVHNNSASPSPVPSEYQSPSFSPQEQSYAYVSPPPFVSAYDYDCEYKSSAISAEVKRASPVYKKKRLQPQHPELFIHKRTKTNKLVWTKALQERFIKALELLGVFDAMPSDVLYFMNVKGLTRGNVSSHLQKYRKKLLKKGNNSSEFDAERVRQLVESC